MQKSVRVAVGEEKVALLISYPDGQSTLPNNAGALPSLTVNAKRNFYQPKKISREDGDRLV